MHTLILVPRSSASSCHYELCRLTSNKDTINMFLVFLVPHNPSVKLSNTFERDDVD